MPSSTPAQQRLFGQAYAVKTGKLDPKDLDPKYRDQIVDLANSMSKKDLEDFAKTKHSKMKESVYEMKNIQTFEQFLNESINKFTIADFPIGAVVHMEDEEWKVVKPGARNGKIFMLPFNKVAKDRHVSVAIEFDLNWLNTEVSKIDK